MRRHPASSGTTPKRAWLPIGLGSLLRLVQIWMPVLGVHSWRQADTAAMARHFSLAGTPIWLPQVDWSGASAGFVESEFPLYPFLVSRLYSLIGVQEWLGRGLSVLCSALTIWLVMRLGRRWFSPEAGWWAGLAFAIAPLGVYFGRAFQAEALLLLCAAGALESLSLWRERRLPWTLALSWVCFTSAGLIKVIPLLWLGLPLLMVQLSSNPQGQAPPLQTLPRRVLRLLGHPGFWLYIGTSLMAIAGWYWHAHQLGQTSGLSFGFWGSGTDRSSISLLLDLNGWINLLLRVSLRLLALVGVPFLLIGLKASWRSGGGQITISSLVGVLLCTIATMRSSTIHEYYQLPLLLFSSPLIGLGWQTWHQQRPRWQPRLLLSLALVVSLTVLSLDYWAVEHRQREAWMPLALTIRRDLPSDARIVSVTSTDPTLLNLARRQGWLISSKQLTPERLQRWKQAGASHLAGSFVWDKTYRPMPQRRQQLLREMVEASPHAWVDSHSQTYLIPIDDLQPRR
ncbi:dolichyl-phosphate-mannose-mannosyltransferase family protein [Synechococcus sp. RS9907]|uniref:ArnT family glycosyltransferase n=1 Tax=Synechococcus sp. RS9907 TaxID=221350 RepID=UPI0018600522|nr:glycosyltransferase family 39 protein [Synechococcus sp. RS9907]QNI83533.1 dolichyl-phosphate-mannose-mannosyltransferase family protein [Synechococcus sp. RS9907]